MHLYISNLFGLSVKATDGEVGIVQDFYFDDQTWIIRYLVIKTGDWLSGRKVLLSPFSLVNKSGKPTSFTVSLTKEQIRNSPDINTDKAVYRQQEIQLAEYYPGLDYWGKGAYKGGVANASIVSDREIIKEAFKKDNQPTVDLHLQSVLHMTGYRIHALDGEIGHAKDFIIADGAWKLQYLVVGMHKLFRDKQVFVPVGNIRKVQWSNAEIYLDITRSAIRNSSVCP
jgi:sporulation protein YlmC with PRC-barrel domain